MQSTRHLIVIAPSACLAVWSGVLLAGDPQPASLVSFSWSATGLASPSAGATCDPGCNNTSGCNTTPNSYSAGGSAMTQQFVPFFASRSCFAVCGGLAIGSGNGQVDASINIASPSFPGPFLQWQWADSIGIQAGAGGGEAVCGTSFGTGQAGAANTWDAVFDVPVGDAGGSAPGAHVTLLTLGYAHSASGSGSAASTWTLDRVGGPTMAGDAIQNGSGNVQHNGTAFVGLAAGRYHFHHMHSASGTHSAPGGNGTQTDAATTSSWSFRFEIYTCANLVSGPQSKGSCAGPGGSAVFSVTGGGSNPQYQWQWRPSDAAAWRNVTTENVNDSNIHAFDAGFSPGPNSVTITNADPVACGTPEFRCTVFNNCASVTSLPARLFIDAADVGGQGGQPGRDGQHNNNDFVVYIDLFFNHDPAADMGSQGGVLGSDGQFDNNDFVVFIDQFFAGC